MDAAFREIFPPGDTTMIAQCVCGYADDHSDETEPWNEPHKMVRPAPRDGAGRDEPMETCANFAQGIGCGL